MRGSRGSAAARSPGRKAPIRSPPNPQSAQSCRAAPEGPQRRVFTGSSRFQRVSAVSSRFGHFPAAPFS
eukprot:2179154-Alexandrium_andersonii.AAC.1